MKLLQFHGPFTTGTPITVPANYDYEYVHIGIQIPDRQPIAADCLIGNNSTPDVEIGSTANDRMQYKINESNILEFDGLAQVSWYIRFLKNVPKETIIDIAYQEIDD